MKPASGQRFHDDEALLYYLQIDRSADAWQVVNDIEFRSITVVAWKGKEGICLEANQAVIYAGPFRSVVDDDGRTYDRGKRTAVCHKTYRILARGPYSESFIRIEPRNATDLKHAKTFDCSRDQLREASETKGSMFHIRAANTECDCKPGTCC